MSSINKTPHYNLSQFGDSPDDKPSWRGDYTADMSKIDSQMYRNETDATTATSIANTAKKTADDALALAKTNKANIDEQESYFNALGVTSQQTAQSLVSTINGKAENTTVTALQGTVTALQGRVSGLSDTTALVNANKTNITDITANLNALHANSISDATLLYNTVQDNSHILRVNQPFVCRGSNIIVTFGDSYAANQNTRSWAYMLAQKLGWTLHNYAVSGAGYVAPNTTYMSEFLKAKEDVSYNHDDVSLVIIGGSRNSNDGYTSTLKTAAQELFRAVNSEYPNARIIAIPLLWDKKPESGYWRYNAASIDEAATLTGVESIPWAWTWNLGRENAFDKEDIHPNELGTNIIVNYIMRYMLGTYNGRHEVFVWRPQQNPAEFVLTVDASAGTITYGLNVASGVTPTNYTNVSGLPMWAWNASDGTNQGQAWVAAITNGANSTTLFHIDTDGHFGWQGYTTNPSGTPNGLAGAQLTRAW